MVGIFPTPYVERDCVIEYDGHTFEAGGAVVTDDRAIVYMPSNQDYEPGSDPRTWHTLPSSGVVTDWHGQPLGTYEVTSSWPHRGWTSERQYAITVNINGRRYYGRTLGAGMYASLKAYRNQ